jgi:hypothetical protein
MKSIFFIGALLMCGAGIYGFVDYQKSKNRQSFKSDHEKNVADTKEKTAPVPKEKITEVKNETVVPVIKNTTALKEAKKDTKEKKSETKDIIKKSKSINYKMFSRAPLKEEYLKVPQPVKEKTITKEEKQ